MTEDTNVQAYMEGLSRLDRVVDDSGYAFTALDVVGKEVVSLAPIKSYEHLLFVNVARNQIVDATPLTELQYLVCVDLSDNAIATPLALPQPHLQAVDVSQNQIPTIQGFQSNSLRSLKINGNVLENLAGLGGLPSLEILEASRNNIGDLSSLGTESSTLEHLELQENKLTTVDGIENLTALRSLALQRNNIETLEALDKLSLLTSLRDLDLSDNPVAETENYRLLLLIQLPNLTTLDGVAITEDERLAAVDLKQQRAEEALEGDAEP